MGDGGHSQRAIPPELQQALYKVAGQDRGMEAILRFANQNSPASDKEKNITQIELQTQRVANILSERFDFVRVKGVGYMGTIYYRPHGTYTFRELTELSRLRLVVKAFEGAYQHKPVKSKIDIIGDSLEAWVDKTVEGLDNSIMEIYPNMYWDVDKAELTRHPNKDCFRSLFDFDPTDKIKVNIKDIDAETLKIYYDETLAVLEMSEGFIDPETLSRGGPMFSPYALPFSPFWTWANEEVDTFNDLLKAVASCFMRNKPKGAFILIGRTRNGKSSYIKMLHALFGSNNTSDLRLTDLRSHHKNHLLLKTMMNAPDEEDEGNSREVLEAQSDFKSMAAHERLLLKVLYSQKPQPIQTDFMSFFPMNDTPSWQGNGAEACMRRSLILMFRNDLSKYDNNGHNFEKETYTPEFYSRLLGVVLAIAHYYNDKKITFSDTMHSDAKAVAEEVDSAGTYLKSFTEHFDGYENLSLIWEDYSLWCVEHNVAYLNKKNFGQRLKVAGTRATNIYMDGQVKRCYSLVKHKPKSLFLSNRVIDGFNNHTVYEVLNGYEENYIPHRPQSIIGELEIKDGEL